MYNFSLIKNLFTKFILSGLFLIIPLLSMAKSLGCKIVIVGGGAGGLHTAYRLGPIWGSGVCLFEKEQQLGGRIKDVSYPQGSGKIGVGARRIMENQSVVFSLASELGLKLETPELGADLIQAHGRYSFLKDDFVSFYPEMPLKDDPNIDQETWLYDKIRKGPDRQNAENYFDLRSYISSVIGLGGLEYLRDMSRFRADFEYPIDPVSYMDYLDEEWDYCCKASYPVGGMSEFIIKMEQKAMAFGVRIFKGESIHFINKIEKGSYRLGSTHHSITTQQVVIAVPPVALNKIKGDIVTKIKEQKVFKDILGIKVVTITQWWPHAWWKDIQNPSITGLPGKVWRGWTADDCINFIEIPQEPYALEQNVTRSVYTDNLKCANYWEELSKKSIKIVESEIKSGLVKLFANNKAIIPSNINIPDPLNTYVQIWPAAWHYLRSGAKVSNREIADWALNPLLGEHVALVGEAYFPNRSGWSDAAYKSSIKYLNAHHGIGIK